MNIKDRLDLFAGEISYGHGGAPCKFLLNQGLTPEQRQEALAIVCQRYSAMGYGTYLDERDNVIRVGSAD